MVASKTNNEMSSPSTQGLVENGFYCLNDGDRRRVSSSDNVVDLNESFNSETSSTLSLLSDAMDLTVKDDDDVQGRVEQNVQPNFRDKGHQLDDDTKRVIIYETFQTNNSTQKVLLVGAGGLGRSIQAWFSTSVIAFIDDDCKDEQVNGIPVLGGLDWMIKQIDDTCMNNVNVVVGVGSIVAAENIVTKLKASTIANQIVFPTLIHEKALVAPTATIQEGVLILPQAIVGPNVSIGSFTLLNCGASVSHDSSVGAFSRIHGGARVLGYCSVGTRTMLGANSVVRDHIKVGNDVVLGCGSSIVKDTLQDELMLGGVPAKQIHRREAVGLVNKADESDQNNDDACALVHPLHGKLIGEPLSAATLKTMNEYLRRDSNGRLGHYCKAIHDPLIFEECNEIQEFVLKHFPGYRAIADILLVQDGRDCGFAWHCDYDTTAYLEDPVCMVSVWFPLVDVTEETGGRLLYTTSPDSHLLGRVETYSRFFHNHPGCGLIHPFGGRVLPLLSKWEKVQNVKKGQGLVFSNHTWHRAELIKKEDFNRPVYVLRLIPKEARFSRRRANLAMIRGNPGPLVRLLEKEPSDRWVDDEDQKIDVDPTTEKEAMERYKSDWMSHYSFQEGAVARLLIDATISSKQVRSNGITISIPACLEEHFVPEEPASLVRFSSALKQTQGMSRLENFHSFITALASIKAICSSHTLDDTLSNEIFKDTFANDAESRNHACQLYDFLRKRPEWCYQLRLTNLNGPNGFFYPPSWTVNILDEYLDHKHSLDADILTAWKVESEGVLSNVFKTSP